MSVSGFVYRWCVKLFDTFIPTSLQNEFWKFSKVLTQIAKKKNCKKVLQNKRNKEKQVRKDKCCLMLCLWKYYFQENVHHHIVSLQQTSGQSWLGENCMPTSVYRVIYIHLHLFSNY